VHNGNYSHCFDSDGVGAEGRLKKSTRRGGKEGRRLDKKRGSYLEESLHIGVGRESSNTVDVCREGRGGSQRAVLLNWRDTSGSRFVWSAHDGCVFASWQELQGEYE
jgi:hypothetical protein